MAARVFQKRPPRVEAIQWTGSNFADLEAWRAPVAPPHETLTGSLRLWVDANEQWVNVHENDWIIRNEHGFVACKPDLFARKYEQVIL